MTPFRIDDGWLYKLRFVEGIKGITPLLSTVSPKAKSAPESDAEPIVSWIYERPGGGRSFTFTGCHLHSSLAEEGYRRFLTNGILWTAGKEIPSSGDAGRLGYCAARSLSSGRAQFGRKVKNPNRHHACRP